MNPNENLNSLDFGNTPVNPLTKEVPSKQNVAKINRVGTTKFLVNGASVKTPKKGKAVFWGILGLIVALIIIGGFMYTVVARKGGKLLSPLADINNGGADSNKTVMHPLTGIMYTEDEAKDWNGKRPIGVMINNYLDARPQWGISDADLVYEIVAEGGITRYLAFFLTDLPDKLGPIRSTREYYLVLVKELGDAALMHIGWSPQALTAIETWPVRSLARGGATFDRDEARLNAGIATEHTAYSSGPYLRELSDSLGWEGVDEFNLWKFKDDSPVNNTSNTPENCEAVAGLCDYITIDFWYQGDYTALFKYVPENNSYLKFSGYDLSGNPVPVLDDNNQKQVEIKNLIIQFVPEVPIEGDDKNRLEYQLVGSGEGLVFLDGKVTPVTWSKSEKEERTMFYDLQGNEIEFNRGKVWISIVPDRNVEQVVY